LNRWTIYKWTIVHGYVKSLEGIFLSKHFSLSLFWAPTSWRPKKNRFTKGEKNALVSITCFTHEGNTPWFVPRILKGIAYSFKGNHINKRVLFWITVPLPLKEFALFWNICCTLVNDASAWTKASKEGTASKRFCLLHQWNEWSTLTWKKCCASSQFLWQLSYIAFLWKTSCTLWTL
jgi:hypothetical protein